MNSKMYKLISSIASVLLCGVLLVCVCLAWYTSSKTISGGVPKVTCSGDKFTDLNLTRYIANESKDDTGNVIGYTLGEPLGEGTTIQPFDLLKPYTKLIYKISFKTTVSNYTISIKNTSNRDSSIAKREGLAADKYYNFLSNVAKFNQLTNSSGNFTLINEEKYLPFSENNINNQNTERHTVVITTSSGSTDGNEILCETYLLYDYNVSNINRLFTLNLGVDLQGGSVIFIDDIQFLIGEVAA